MAISPGTVAIRNYLRAQGVPDDAIQWDGQEGVVRVGGHTIKPTQHVGGTTYATPEALQGALSAVRNIMADVPRMPAQPQRSPFEGPGGPEAVGQNTIRMLAQSLPRLGALASSVSEGIPFLPSAVEAHAGLTGMLPSGGPTMATQQFTADLFNQLAATSGVFGQTPALAGAFADMLSGLAGQPTEQRRHSMAMEALQRAAIAEQAAARRQQADLARQQAELAERMEAEWNTAIGQIAQEISEGKITNVSQLVNRGAEFGLATDHPSMASLERFLYADDKSPDTWQKALSEYGGSTPSIWDPERGILGSAIFSNPRSGQPLNVNVNPAATFSPVGVEVGESIPGLPARSRNLVNMAQEYADRGETPGQVAQRLKGVGVPESQITSLLVQVRFRGD